jgi:hypothetical protein
VQTHIFHIYHDIHRADDVVDRLLSSGIGRKHISILTTEAGGARHLAMTEGTKAGEGGNMGAAIGGAVGLIGGSLITAATAGVGILAVGPLLTGLAGLGAGAVTGGLIGALIGVGIPEAEAKFYAQEISEKDAILVGVEVTESDRNLVRQILSNNKETFSNKSDA